VRSEAAVGTASEHSLALVLAGIGSAHGAFADGTSAAALHRIALKEAALLADGRLRCRVDDGDVMSGISRVPRVSVDVRVWHDRRLEAGPAATAGDHEDGQKREGGVAC
jgi:hypothetical protein